MKPSLLLSALLVAVPMTVAPAATAGSDLDLQSLVSGTLCSMSPVTYHPDGTASTILRGGPLHAIDPSASIWLLCTIQVNAFTHDGPDAGGTRTWGIGSVTQEPTEVRFAATPRDVVVLCQETWVNTGGGHISPVFDGRTFVLSPGAACSQRLCSFSSISDPAGEDEAQVGQINAGPITATSAGASIQITCTIQVGALNSTHAGADADFVTSTVSTQVASIPPTEDDQPPTISYVSPENVPVFLCTEAIINGTSWYWDDTVVEEGYIDQWDARRGWTTSSSGRCNEAISQEIFPGPFEPVVLLLDELVFCPLLDDVLDGSAVDAPPFKIGDDGQPDDADLYYDFNGDNQFTDDEWIFDCPPYRP